MLTIEEIHAAISEVCPIVGLADLGDGNYRIDFAPSATQEQIDAANDLLDSLVADGTTLAIAKTKAKDAVKSLRSEYENGGFTWNGYEFQSDAGSREKLLGSFLGAKDGLRANDAVWRLADNTEVPFTNAEMIQIGYSLFAHMQTCSAVSFAHQNAIDALTTITAVEAYDYTQGWS